jgi:hypothetical protein
MNTEDADDETKILRICEELGYVIHRDDLGQPNDGIFGETLIRNLTINPCLQPKVSRPTQLQLDLFRSKLRDSNVTEETKQLYDGEPTDFEIRHQVGGVDVDSVLQNGDHPGTPHE